MTHIITIDVTKCTGCRMCEVACSLKHVGECNPDRSCIRVVMTEEGGQLDFVPVTCMQCEKAMCELVCPADAISRDPQTGARIVSIERCIGCSACSYACPFGACFIDRDLRRAVLCDQCDGDSLCVELCPTGALQRIRADEVNVMLKQAGAKRLLDVDQVGREAAASALALQRYKE